MNKGRQLAVRLLVAAFCGLFAAASAGAAWAAGDPPAGPAAVEATLSWSPDDAPGLGNGRYPEWTLEKMRRARPYPLPELPGAPGRPPPVPTPPGGEPPILVPGSEKQLPPGPGEPGEGFSLPVEAGESRGYAYPPPFTRYENFDRYRRMPYRTVGKLFFTQYGLDYVCTAASIGNNAVWTAGHCLHAGDGTESGWSSNVVFVPAFRDGYAPHGRWRASRLLVTPSWKNGRRLDYRQDYGGAVLKLKGGRKISQVASRLGFAANAGTNVHWMNFGYPVAGSFYPGYRMNICAASWAYSDGSMGIPFPSAMGCDMTPGCSGGPWIIRFRSGSYLNGNNSYRYEGNNLEIYSPYFDTDAYDFYQALTAAEP